MIGCLRTLVRKQPIIVLYLEFETVLKFYSLEARTDGLLLLIWDKQFAKVISRWLKSSLARKEWTQLNFFHLVLLKAYGRHQLFHWQFSAIILFQKPVFIKVYLWCHDFDLYMTLIIYKVHLLVMQWLCWQRKCLIYVVYIFINQLKRVHCLKNSSCSTEHEISTVQNN